MSPFFSAADKIGDMYKFFEKIKKVYKSADVTFFFRGGQKR
jgi:hypothetical protein